MRAYLFKVATNLAIDRLRYRRVRGRTEERVDLFEDLSPGTGASDDPASQFLARERASTLLGFLQELPPKCQAVFGRHRLEGVPQQEVAATLGISERMVRRYVTYTMVYCQLRLTGLSAAHVRTRVSP